MSNYTLTINGVDRTKCIQKGISISSASGSSASDMSFSMVDRDGEGIPLNDQEVIITQEGERLFGGRVLRTKPDASLVAPIEGINDATPVGGVEVGDGIELDGIDGRLNLGLEEEEFPNGFSASFKMRTHKKLVQLGSVLGKDIGADVGVADGDMWKGREGIDAAEGKLISYTWEQDEYGSKVFAVYGYQDDTDVVAGTFTVKRQPSGTVLGSGNLLKRGVGDSDRRMSDFIWVPQGENLEIEVFFSDNTDLYIERVTRGVAGYDGILTKEGVFTVYMFSIANYRFYLNGNRIHNGGNGDVIGNDVWQDVTFTYDNSDFKIYRNGSLLRTVSCDEPMDVNSNPWILGIRNGRPWWGTFSNILFHNRAISQQEVEGICNEGKIPRKGLIGNWSGEKYEGDWDNPTSILDDRMPKGTIWDVECVDYTRDLDRNLVVEGYQDMTDKEIIVDIVDNYCGGTGITYDNVDEDILIHQIVFNYMPLSECFSTIAKLTGRQWYMDYNKDIHYGVRDKEEAPFHITGFENYSHLVWNLDNSALKNRVYVRGGTYLSDETTIKQVADGEETTFFLPERPHELKIFEGATQKTVGIKNVNDFEEFDYLMSYQEKYVETDVAPSEGTVMTFEFKYNIPVLVAVEDKDSIEKYGQMEFVIFDNKINTIDQARERAVAELEDYAETIKSANFDTYETGFKVGQYMNVNLPWLDIDEQFVVSNIRASSLGGGKFRYRVKIVSAEMMGIVQFLINLLESDKNALDISTDEVVDEITTVETATYSLVDTTPVLTSHEGAYEYDDAEWDMAEWSEE